MKEWGCRGGASQVQKDDNYITFTVNPSSSKLFVAVKEKQKEEEILSTTEIAYSGSIIFKIKSEDHKYFFEYSLDDGKHFSSCAETSAALTLSLGYTGSCLGLYCTSKGQVSTDSATYAWVRHSASMRWPEMNAQNCPMESDLVGIEKVMRVHIIWSIFLESLFQILLKFEKLRSCIQRNY